MVMIAREPAGAIEGYHAHVYYHERSKPVAAQLRDAVENRFEVRLGRWHDQPIGPHPCGSYQIEFKPELFAELVPWLALNRQDLSVFIHPQTGNALADHTAHVIWLGDSWQLNLAALG